jgi:tetratricopeptide (TPR) repeat protein
MAFKQDDPRYYLELDRLYEQNNEALDKRLELFSEHQDVVEVRNDSYTRHIEVLILNGQYEKALMLLTKHTFLRQEGVVNLHDLFVDAHLLKGRELLQEGKAELALGHFLQADTYPENQMIGRISDYQKEAQIYYFTALAYRALNKEKEAKDYFKKASEQDLSNSEYLFYKSMALRELGFNKEADRSMHKLLQDAQKALENAGDADFFAKFGERRNMDERRAQAYFEMALAYKAAGQEELAQEKLV